MTLDNFTHWLNNQNKKHFFKYEYSLSFKYVVPEHLKSKVFDSKDNQLIDYSYLKAVFYMKIHLVFKYVVPEHLKSKVFDFKDN